MDFTITSVSFQPATSDKGGSKAIMAHSVVRGELADRTEFEARFSESASAYLDGERLRNKRLPDAGELAQALRDWYRDKQNQQVATLVSRNRQDELNRIMAQKAAGATVTVTHNHAAANPDLMRIESDVISEAEAAEALGIGDDAPVPPRKRR